jgi:hypothetical protein
MDAVVFMESMSAPGGAAGTPPPPPAEQKSSSRMNANAALIAGVATLVLAIGVGFLIGRSGHENSTQAAAPIKVIEVGGGGGGESTATASGESTETATESGKGSSSTKKGAKKAKTSEVKENSKQEEELAAEKTAETLHAEGPLAKPKAQVGEACEKGTPGCNGKEFTGEFFGE